MRSNKKPYLLAALLGAVFTAEVHAQPTTFTYQGQLIGNGGPATGLFDLRFDLLDSPTNGTSLGVVTNLASEVRNGVFTVPLDFGADVFDGGARWVEIGVRTNGATAFDTLSPRQLLTSIPYAIHAGSMSAAGLTGTINATNIAPGTISGDMLVDGSITSSQLSTSVGIWSRLGNDIHYNDGNVGIGITSPSQALEIGADSQGQAALALTVPHVFNDPASRQRPASDASVGVSGTPWLNPKNALAADGAYATCSISGDRVTSSLLIVTNFGFSIPRDATITGIEVTCRASINDSSDFSTGKLMLRLTTGGATRTFTGDKSPEGNIILGSSFDVWASALTPAMVNNPGFGAQVQCESGSSTFFEAQYRILLDLVLITVHYTTPRNGSQSYTFGSPVNSGDLRFSPGPDLTAPAMTLTRDGRLGVGTTVPSSTLEVNGIITASSFLGSEATLTATTSASALTVNNASTQGVGIEAFTASTNSGKGAVVGRAGGTSGVLINSVAGLLGDSGTARGVIGTSKSSDGVFGWSTSGAGVKGQSQDGYGVQAYSANGHAVYAQGTIHATGDISTEGSVTADKVVYNAAHTNYLSLPPAAFEAVSESSSTTIVRGWAGSGLYFTAGTLCAVSAPVELPQGATVKSVKMYLIDNDATYNLRTFLVRTSLSDGTGYAMASIESSAASSSHRMYLDDSIVWPTVNNSQYAYEVRSYPGTGYSEWATAGSNLQLYGVVIEYTVAEAE